MQCAVDRHNFNQHGMEELSELCHQAAPLVQPGVVAEEAVQRGVKRVCDLHLGPQGVNDVPTSTGLWVEDGSGQWTDGAPRLGQRVIILHLTCNREMNVSYV